MMLHVVETGRPEVVESELGLFCLFNGMRRYIPTMDILGQYVGETAPRRAPRDEIDGYRDGPHVPRKLFPRDASTLDFHVFREYVCRNLYGSGVEFGAGPRPLPVPVRCRVQYADIFNEDEFHEKSTAMFGLEKGTKFIDIDLIDTMDEMKAIPVQSLDFITASHVIEHTRRPLMVFKNAYDRLRDGGSLVLVVPDRNRTFDRLRPVTSIDHHLADFYMPSRERDLEHFIEATRLVERGPRQELEPRARDRWERQEDTHMHTFTPDSFVELAEWACETIGFASFEIHDGMLTTASNEFYVVFRK